MRCKSEGHQGARDRLQLPAEEVAEDGDKDEGTIQLQGVGSAASEGNTIAENLIDILAIAPAIVDKTGGTR